MRLTRLAGFLFLAGLCAVSAPAFARDGDRLAVAVLDLANDSRKATGEDAQFLSQVVREAVANAFDPTKFHVMTAAEMFTVATPEQIQQCVGKACILNIGRTLQADVVIGGRVGDVGSMLGVMFEAYRTSPGGLLASPTTRAKSVDELVEKVREEAGRLVRQVLDRIEPQAPPEGVLRIDGSPVGAEVEILGPKGFGIEGRLSGFLPWGPEPVPVGDYRVRSHASGFDEALRVVRVVAGATKVLPVDLRPLTPRPAPVPQGAPAQPAAVPPRPAAAPAVDLEAARAVAREWISALGRWDCDAVETLLAPDFHHENFIEDGTLNESMARDAWLGKERRLAYSDVTWKAMGALEARATGTDAGGSPTAVVWYRQYVCLRKPGTVDSSIGAESLSMRWTGGRWRITLETFRRESRGSGTCL